ncbi:MAG: carboxypeptidase-like regulatory domain-containing protein [Acidobacteriota bacterium]
MSNRDVLAIAGLVVPLLAASLIAQDPRGAITGSVTDATNAVIAGATVRATNAETGVAAAAASNAAGSFHLPFLPSGMYRVTAELAGFKRFVRDNVEVRVGETVGLPIRMEVGEVTESVEVVDTTPLLDTTGSSLGQVIDQRRIQELPQRGYNPMELTLLTPGVVNATNLRLRKAHAPGATSEIAAEGTGSYNTEFQIDGISNMSSDRGRDYSRIAFIPPIAAVREFKMQTTAYDASVGRTMGAVVNVSTASGTNDLHGELHYVLRHSALDAPNFFVNKAGTKMDIYQDNRHGGSAGGPLVLPRLYNGKNRTFWLYVYEDNRFGVPKQWTNTVPTAVQRTGDFSGLLGIPGANYQIYDPRTTTPAPSGRFSRQPFANNLIPRSRLDPVGLNLLPFYPLPNQPGTADGRNNSFVDKKSIHKFYQHLLRLDHAFSENHRAFLRLHYDMWKEDKNDNFGTNIMGIFQNRPNRGVALDDVIVLNPTLVLNVRYGLTSTKWWQFRRSRGWDLAGLGFSPSLLGLLERREAPLPRVSPGAYTVLSNWEDPGDGVNSSLTNSFAGHFTKLQGNHAMKFGADFRVYRSFANRRPTGVAPDFTFDTTYTRGPLDNATSAPIGQDLASMLLGVPGGSMVVSASAALQDTYLALYWQDDIKLTSRLALNVGVRWENETPMTERFDRLVAGFDSGVSNPIEAQARANYAARPIPELSPNDFRVRGGLSWVKQGGADRSPFRGEKNNFMPRLGLAYQINQKTILRGGYGLFFGPVGTAVTLPIQTGFSQATPIQASLDSGLTYLATTANPFPSGLRQPLGPAGGLTTNLGQGIDFYNYNEKHAYAQRWSLGIQRMLPAQFVLDASYVANRSTRLGVDRQFNVTPAQYLSRSPARDQATIDFLSATFPSPFRGLDPIYGANISRANLLRPYPHFGNIVADQPIGYGWYHSMQLLGEKRFSQGYTLQLGYTFSKLMEANVFLNATDPMPYESIASLDRPHRLTASGIWELPFGKSRRFGGAWPRGLDLILGGWQLGAILTRQSGAPLEFGNIIFNGEIKNIPLPQSQRDVDRWFNTGAGFNRDSRQQLASNLRTFPMRFSGIRGDDQRSWDISIVKDFPIREGVKIRFRGDVYNALNQTNFATPNRTPTSSAFGTITGTDGDPRNWQLGLRLQF